MTNLTIESNKQNETIDSKLNIDINNLRQFFIKGHIRKCESNVQTCCFDSKICLSQNIFLHIKFHTFFYGKNSNLLYFTFY